MAAERILDAEVLMNAGRWSFAYYVAGYAVECAPKVSGIGKDGRHGRRFCGQKVFLGLLHP